MPLYAVLLALVAGDYTGAEPIPTDRVLLGVIHIPPLDETISAARGLGASWNGGPASVSTQARLSEARVGTTDFIDLQRREPRLAGCLSRTAGLSRTWGDAYGYLLVATGRLDLMIDPIVSPWDVAPLPVIIEESGGRYTDLDGSGVLGASAVATNGHIHDEVLASR